MSLLFKRSLIMGILTRHMDYRSLLNEKQYEAVSTSSLYTRVIAGAGSGKTRVLTYRISYLITECNVDPMNILAIAFTNKVAAEMKERATQLIKDNMGGCPNLNISTFHAWCARFLRIEHSFFDYPANFTIYDEDDQMRLIKNVAVDLGYKKSDPMVKTATQYIRKRKGRGQYPSNINPHNFFSHEEKICLDFYAKYEEEKAKGYGLDFDDLLNVAIDVLKENEEVRSHWANKYDHILIDEFQDTNDVQFELLKLLMKPDTSVYVVGDPDQTIYSWRGANPKIILDYDQIFKGAETIILNQNYRSTQTILDAANKLIAHNKKRVPKDLFATNSKGDPIQVKISGTADYEADWVANKINYLARKDMVDGKPSYSNIAILYRSSYLTRPFESSLKDKGIPYRIFGGLRFYERMEVKDVLAYFNLLVNDFDNVSFERIVNVPKRGIGDGTLLKIREEAAESNVSEYQYMAHINEHPNTMIPGKAINQISSFISIMEKTKVRLEEKIEAYAGILKDMITDLGYLKYIAEEEDPDEDRLGNVNALFDDINHFISNNPDSTFSEYLQNVALLTAQDDISQGNYVSLMTCHVAKGLEFDYVFVIGLNQGTFPSARAMAETERDGVEEERRLAYVAFTRAKKILFLSGNRSYSYVTDSKSAPSEYFHEAGIELPRENEFTSSRVWQSPGGGRKPIKRYSDFFSDGDAISPFEESEKKAKPAQTEKPKNDIVWKVGDKVHHEKFGDGVVANLVSDSIIVVEFVSEGKKTLMANHPMLSKISSSGGEA